jgi:predicted ester cyclase
VTAALNETVIRRFYDRLWNRWELDLADEIVARDVRFRGSLGTELTGVEAFKGYVRDVQAAFPDWHNRIDELITAGDRVVARLTWSGTHEGELLGLAPTGRFVTYVGAAIFRLEDALIEEGWVVGDTHDLWRALGRLR